MRIVSTINCDNTQSRGGCQLQDLLKANIREDDSMDNEDRFIGCCSNRGTEIEVLEFRAKGVNLDSLEVLSRSDSRGLHQRGQGGPLCVDEELWGPISRKETRRAQTLSAC